MRCIVDRQEILLIIITIMVILHDPERSRWRLKGLKGALQLLGSMKDLLPLDIDKQAEGAGLSLGGVAHSGLCPH